MIYDNPVAWASSTDHGSTSFPACLLAGASVFLDPPALRSSGLRHSTMHSASDSSLPCTDQCTSDVALQRFPLCCRFPPSILPQLGARNRHSILQCNTAAAPWPAWLSPGPVPGQKIGQQQNFIYLVAPHLLSRFMAGPVAKALCFA